MCFCLTTRPAHGLPDSYLLSGVESVFFLYFSNYYFGRLVTLLFISAF